MLLFHLVFQQSYFSFHLVELPTQLFLRMLSVNLQYGFEETLLAHRSIPSLNPHDVTDDSFMELLVRSSELGCLLLSVLHASFQSALNQVLLLLHKRKHRPSPLKIFAELLKVNGAVKGLLGVSQRCGAPKTKIFTCAEVHCVCLTCRLWIFISLCTFHGRKLVLVHK